MVIPALNEEHYLSQTIAAIRTSQPDVEVVVVDNGSTDATVSVAASAGARVVSEPARNIARARNRGARAASEDVLVFVDADTLVPPAFFAATVEALRDESCIGGAADTLYKPRRRTVRLYLQLWRVIGLVGGMAQGAAQFVRRDTFEAIGGYDESLWMGEDVDFYWRLKKFARRTGGRVQFLRHVRVEPSPRRFDQWSLWQILLRTNPLFILLFRRRRAAWKSWYEKPIR